MTNNTQSNEKTMCILAYLVFFLPLIVIPNSQAGRFHSNQGLLVLLLSILTNIIASIRIPFISGLIGGLGWILIIVLIVMGMINANNNEMKELPVIGKFRIIK